MKKKLFFLLVLGLIVYSLFLIVIPHYNYHAFRSDLRELLRVSITDTRGEIMEEILNLAEKYNIPIEKEDINLEKKGLYVVTISWEETVDFFTIYQKTFEFYIDTSERR